jgi:hypothetical protein
VRLAGSNISQTSLLATDYLNHYNEVIMIVDMLPDMPEMLEDIEGWRPRSYAEHFRDCGFSYAELAIEAYEHAPAEFRRTFDDTRQKLDEMTLFAVRTLAACVTRNREGELRERCAVFARAMQALADTMAATINGSATKADDALIRSILGKG